MKRDPFNIAVATDAWGSGTIHGTGEIEGRMFKSDIQSLHIDICTEKTEIKGVPTETDFIVGIRFKIEDGNPILTIESVPGIVKIDKNNLDPS